MQFVSETAIDQAAENLGKSEDFATLVQDLKTHQPVILAYLFSENFMLLTQREREYMIFLTLIIWKASLLVNPDLEFVEQEMIEVLEERNWTQLNESKSKKFDERIDSFFKDYPQEDLLAFVEDAMEIDEEADVTKEGRDYVFIALKTIIDSFHRSVSEE